MQVDIIRPDYAPKTPKPEPKWLPVCMFAIGVLALALTALAWIPVRWLP